MIRNKAVVPVAYGDGLCTVAFDRAICIPAVVQDTGGAAVGRGTITRTELRTCRTSGGRSCCFTHA